MAGFNFKDSGRGPGPKGAGGRPLGAGDGQAADSCEEPPLLGWWPAVHGLLSQRWFTVGDISPLILRGTHKRGESQGGRRGANENPRIMVRSTEAREGGR